MNKILRMGKTFWTVLFLIILLNGSLPAQAASSRAVGISAGYTHALALMEDGTVWAWGDNKYGQAGVETSISVQPIPAKVMISDVIAVSAGGGQSLALKKDGTVWAWGYNEFGQLGDGTTTSTSAPMQVKGLPWIVSIAAGSLTSFALDENGDLWAWGFNERGDVGDGTYINRPTPVKTLSNIAVIGERGSYAIDRSGQVWAWGFNIIAQRGDYKVFGAIGDFSPVDSHPVPFRIDGLSDVKNITKGAAHTSFLKNDGTVWAWGGYGSGQFGNGSVYNIDNPAAVKGPVKALIDDVSQISTACDHIIAIKGDGSVWEWGNIVNARSGGAISQPVQVKGIKNAVSVSSGNYFCLALDADGNVWGWGRDMFGELCKAHQYGNIDSAVYVSSPIKLIEGIEGSGAQNSPTKAPTATQAATDPPASTPMNVSGDPASSSDPSIEQSPVPTPGFDFSVIAILCLLAGICISMYAHRK